jgi:hypothetical protein
VLSRIRYLDFAARWYSQVAYDLASSGIAPITAMELGAVAADDYFARKSFREAVAARYGVDASEVVPCLGTSGALFAAYTSFCNGGHVLVEKPAYEPLLRVAAAAGAHVERFERRRPEGFRLDAERVLGAIRPETELVVVTNPHNPTGALATDADLQVLAQGLASRGVRLVVDEAYLELAHPGHTARRLGENVVTCSSATKCWGVPWARAGWLLVPPESAETAAHVERHVCGSAPPACWAWGTLALARAGELLVRAAKLQTGKRALVEAFLARHAALGWAPPHAQSPYGWITADDGESLDPLLEHAIQSEGVLVAPGRFFDDPASFRLSWTAPLEVVSEGLLRLDRAFQTAP